ncbi:MAG: hypothetical protein AB1726_05325 [Planctomycetota bacterium]
MKTPALALAGLVLLAAPASAERLDPRLVPATARFLVHIDVEGLKRTELWTGLLALAAASEEDLLTWMAVLEAETTMDPRRDLQSVTLFGSHPDPEHLVVLVAGNERLDGLVARLEKEPSHRLLDMEGVSLHQVDADGQSLVGFPEERGEGRLFLGSYDPGELLRAVRVLRGRDPSLARAGEAPLPSTPREGSFLFLSATGQLPGLDEIGPESVMLGHAKSIALELGEANGVLDARLSVTVKSEEMARNASEVIQGLAALGRLAVGAGEEDMKPLADLLDRLRFGRSGDVVTVGLSFETKALLGLAQGHVAIKAKRDA